MFFWCMHIYSLWFVVRQALKTNTKSGGSDSHKHVKKGYVSSSALQTDFGHLVASEGYI